MPPTGIYIVRSEKDSLPEEPVVEHQQRAIEKLKFVVPQDIKDSWLGSGGITNQPAVVQQHPEDLLYKPSIRPFIPTQIKKDYS